MADDHDRRVAVVTGGGRGIGRAIALRLASMGHAVVVSSRTQADLDAVVGDIVGAGGQCLPVVADALDRSDARRPVEEALARFGRVDVLVNNVGGAFGSPDPFDADDEDFEMTLALTLTTSWWSTRAALGAMRERKWGRVVNIGSTASTRSTPNGKVGYTAAKHGLVGLTRQLALVAGPHGITVNCVCPGWTNTSMLDWETIAEGRGVTPEEARESARECNVQHRILEPEEIAGMVALLVSDEGYGITGQVLGVDGGSFL